MPQLLDAQNPDLGGLIRPGDTVLWGQANAEPLPLTRALMAQRARFERIRVMLGINHSDTCRPEHADHVDFLAYCGAGANRELVRAGVLDILPCHYSQLPGLMRSRALPIDVLLLQLSPPDEQGRLSLSLAHEYLLPALDSTRVVIAEVNRQAPWVQGERYLTLDDLDAVLYSDRPPLESAVVEPRPADRLIAGHIAGLIEDGATLQLGIGAIPDAVLGALTDRRDLGIHSGSLGDGVAQLMQRGVVTNRLKPVDRGLTVGGVLLGSQALHAFAHRNPAISLRSTHYTHDPDVLASLERFVAINSAVEVDLTGQINSEVAGGRYIGAVGGALDFLRGAGRSRGGLPIVALPARAGANDRIVARLGGPVTVPRSDAGLIVTEYGVADLRGLSLEQRVQRMLDIAHPDSRAQLETAFAAG